MFIIIMCTYQLAASEGLSVLRRHFKFEFVGFRECSMAFVRNYRASGELGGDRLGPCTVG